MSKYFDIILIIALIINITNTFRGYSEYTEVLNYNIPTWVSISIQIFCILILGFKAIRNHRANK